MNFILGRSISKLVASSFEVSKVIAQRGKPVRDGDYIKEAWLECAPFLFEIFQKKKRLFSVLRFFSE